MIPDILGTGPERANNEPTLSMDHSLNPLFFIAFFYIERSGMNSCHFYMYFYDVRLSLYIYRKTCAAPKTSSILHKSMPRVINRCPETPDNFGSFRRFLQ